MMSTRNPTKPLHRKKLFGGRFTAEEIHAKYAFPPDAKCGGCGKTGGLQTRAIVLMPLDEMKKRDPMFDILAEVRPEEFLKILVPSKYGPLVRISTAYACPSCTPALEKTLAKAPDYAVIDLNKGVGADKVVRGYGD